MKNLIFVIVSISLMALPAFAKKSRTRIPQEALAAMTALLSPDIQAEAEEFYSDLGYIDSAETITMGEDELINAVHIIRGKRVLDGDIICGDSKLTITEELLPNPSGGFGFIRYYEAYVEKTGDCGDEDIFRLKKMGKK